VGSTFSSTHCFHQFAHAHTGLLVLAAINFSLPSSYACSCVWGLRRERFRLRKSLGNDGARIIVRSELVRHADDRDELL